MKNLIQKIINTYNHSLTPITFFNTYKQTSAIPHHLLSEYLLQQRQRLRGFRLYRLPEPLLHPQLVVRQVQK